MAYRIIPPREALVDPRTGNVTHSWYRFFEHLGFSVGPGSAATGSATGGPSGGTGISGPMPVAAPAAGPAATAAAALAVEPAIAAPFTMVGGRPAAGGGGPRTLEEIVSLSMDIGERTGTNAGASANELAELRTLAFLPSQTPSIDAAVTNVQSQLDDLRRAVYEALFPSSSIMATPVMDEDGCCLPLTNGDLPGPTLVSDGYGQCIAVPIGADE